MFKRLSKVNRFLVIITQIIIFLFLVNFFLIQCPVVAYDCDDWLYISLPRIPIPLWGAWNPSKILPETLMPVAGWTAVHLIYPITGNYVHSITIICAIIISLCILFMCICVFYFFNKRLSISVRASICLETLFLILCFAIFRNKPTSRYLFQARDLNCIFNYTIPGVLNMAVVLIMLSYNNFNTTFKKWNIGKKCCFISLIYFTVFSNLFQSVIIAVYAFTNIVFDLASSQNHMQNNHNKQISFSLKNHKIDISILILWIIAAIFEKSGGRSGYIGNEFELSLSFNMLKAMISAVAKPFAILMISAVMFMLIRQIKNRVTKDVTDSEYIFIFNFSIFSLILITLYLLSLCSNVTYMSRIEGSWAIWIYFVFITTLGIAQLIHAYPQVKIFLPLFVLITSLCTMYPDGKFMNSTADNRDYKTCINIDNFMINQFIKADKSGNTSAQIYIPDYTDTDFSPMLTDTLVQNMNGTLFRHGIIKHEIKVKTVIDGTLNDKLSQ